MKTNIKIKNRGWQILVVILVLHIFSITSVYALENESNLNEVEEMESTLIKTEDILTQPKDEEVIEEELEFITREEIWQFNSTDIEFLSKEVIIKGNINESITVEEILDNINIEELKNNYNIIDIYIINNLGDILTSSDIITKDNTIVFLGKDYINTYNIKLLGDYTIDGIIDSKDVEQALENNILDQEEVTTESVSYIDYVIDNNTYEIEEIITDKIDLLENKLEIENKDIYLDEEIIIKYTLTGLSENNINAISGYLDYDKNALELIDIYFSGQQIKKEKFNEQYFIYLLNNKKEESPLMFLMFKSKTSGNHKISLNNIKLASNGTLIKTIENTYIELLVQEYGKGGDVEIIVPPIIDNITSTNTTAENFSPQINTLQNSQTFKETPIIQTTVIYLSNDNYLKDLIIKGYKLDFNKDITNYKINIKEKVNKLELELELSNKNATYFIKGNDNLKLGKNIITLTIQAEDGSTRDYFIEVNKEQEGNNIKTEEKVRKTISIIILGILILSIIWCLYLLIKKDPI